MNSKFPGQKTGIFDHEINKLSKILFVFMALVSLLIVGLNGFYANWWLMYFRFVLLLSSIIPISL
jgi:phospholipid-translocating ATPase